MTVVVDARQAIAEYTNRSKWIVWVYPVSTINNNLGYSGYLFEPSAD